jgi:hypothetical protein
MHIGTAAAWQLIDIVIIINTCTPGHMHVKSNSCMYAYAIATLITASASA